MLNDEFVIISNHFNGIICIAGANPCIRPDVKKMDTEMGDNMVSTQQKPDFKQGDNAVSPLNYAIRPDGTIFQS